MALSYSSPRKSRMARCSKARSVSDISSRGNVIMSQWTTVGYDWWGAYAYTPISMMCIGGDGYVKFMHILRVGVDSEWCGGVQSGLNQDYWQVGYARELLRTVTLFMLWVLICFMGYGFMMLIVPPVLSTGSPRRGHPNRRG